MVEGVTVVLLLGVGSVWSWRIDRDGYMVGW